MGIFDRLKGKKEEEEIPEFGPGDLGDDLGLPAPRTPAGTGTPSAPAMPAGTAPTGGTNLPAPSLPPLPSPATPPAPSLPPLTPEPLPPSNFPAPGAPDDVTRNIQQLSERLKKLEERVAYLERALYGRR